MRTRSQAKPQEPSIKSERLQRSSDKPALESTELNDAGESLPHGLDVDFAKIATQKRSSRPKSTESVKGTLSKVVQATETVAKKSLEKARKKTPIKRKNDKKEDSKVDKHEIDGAVGDNSVGVDESTVDIKNHQSIPKHKKWPSSKLQLGCSPFPEHEHPTSAEAFEVARRLKEAHGPNERPEKMPVPSKTVAGCGEVDFILEALVRTMISAHVAMENANKAIEGMAYRYEIFEDGITPNCLNWKQVLDIDSKTLQEAIRPAGIQVKRSGFIRGLLEKVRGDNELLLGKLKKFMEASSLTVEDLKSNTNEDGKIIMIQPGAVIPSINGTAHLVDEAGIKLTDLDEFKVTRIQKEDDRQTIQAKIMSNVAVRALLTEGQILTLDFIHVWPDKVAFEYMQTFTAIGVKTSACVTLFCLQRPLFAMDTHLHRICRMLNWVPGGADFDQAFFHCDALVPDELKYCLHQLMIKHGQQCAKCKAGSDPNSEVYKSSTCCLEDLLIRPSPRPRKKAAASSGKKRAKEDDSSDEGDIDPKEGRKNKATARASKKAAIEITKGEKVDKNKKQTTPKKPSSSTPAKSTGTRASARIAKTTL